MDLYQQILDNWSNWVSGSMMLVLRLWNGVLEVLPANLRVIRCSDTCVFAEDLDMFATLLRGSIPTELGSLGSLGTSQSNRCSCYWCWQMLDTRRSLLCFSPCSVPVHSLYGRGTEFVQQRPDWDHPIEPRTDDFSHLWVSSLLLVHGWNVDFIDRV